MEALLKQDQVLTPQGRARITEIEDLLIDRFVQHREATEKGQRWVRRNLRPKSRNSSTKRTTWWDGPQSVRH